MIYLLQQSAIDFNVLIPELNRLLDTKVSDHLDRAKLSLNQIQAYLSILENIKHGNANPIWTCKDDLITRFVTFSFLLDYPLDGKSISEISVYTNIKIFLHEKFTILHGDLTEWKIGIEGLTAFRQKKTNENIRTLFKNIYLEFKRLKMEDLWQEKSIGNDFLLVAMRN